MGQMTQALQLGEHSPPRCEVDELHHTAKLGQVGQRVLDFFQLQADAASLVGDFEDAIPEGRLVKEVIELCHGDNLLSSRTACWNNGSGVRRLVIFLFAEFFFRKLAG